MLVAYADDLFQEHELPGDHPECPERLVVIGAALRRSASVARWEPGVPGEVADVVRVHDPDYVSAVHSVSAAGVLADLGLECYVGPRSYDAALRATGTLVEATRRCLAAGPDDPARRAFCAVRPPGHHARPARGMGFCLFNNVAVAAAWARAEAGLDRVAIVDFDVHHGNGTQEAFYEDGSVLYVSVHRDRFYPGSGGGDETGVGAGKGATKNLPLPAATTSLRWREAFREGLGAVEEFRPQLVLASAGFDAYRHDPLGGLGLREDDFQWVGENLHQLASSVCEGRLVSVLEGGYAVDALGDLVAAYVEGAAGDV